MVMRNMREKNLTENLCWGETFRKNYLVNLQSFPKPEGEFRGDSLTKPHFGVTSAEVAIKWPRTMRHPIVFVCCQDW